VKKTSPQHTTSGNIEEESGNSFEESLEAVLQYAPRLPHEEVNLLDAVGRVLAQDVVALSDEPPAPKSRMDGYALRAEDTAQATPENPIRFVFEEVVGAGHLAQAPVGPGRVVRLMTGAWLPEGADAVVKQEDTRSEGEAAVLIQHPLLSGENVISPGALRTKGERMLLGGRVVSPQALGMLASLGIDRVLVHQRPRVALLALGDELVEPGQPLKPGQLHVSNIYTLEAKIRAYGAIPHRLGIAPDDPEEIENLLRPLIVEDPTHRKPEQCDVLLTLGGSHGGDYDFAGRVLEQLGAVSRFRRTRFNMGASTQFATRGQSLFFCLPGTPMPSWAAFELLVRPALWKMSGRAKTAQPRVEAQLTAPVYARPGFTNFIPGWLYFTPQGEPRIEPLRDRKEGALPPALLANAFILMPDGIKTLPAGDRVQTEWIGLSAEGAQAD